jgi:hypothetical protein
MASILANTLDLGALEQDALTLEDKYVRDLVDIQSPQDDDPYSQVSFQTEIDNLLTPKVWKKLETEYQSKKEGIIKSVSDRRKKLEERRAKILQQLKNPKFIRTKDKIAFTLGVSLTITTSLIAAGTPWLLPDWYVFWCILLLTARFFMYHSQRYHYFMLDFCYFSNLLLIFYLKFYPTSPELYILNFANACGPLLWAIVTWRNSLVFHSLDKITSIFIHAFPPTVLYVLRFNQTGNYYATCLNMECSVSMWWIYVPSLAFFLFWQICYLFKTEVIDRKLFHETSELTTSYRWMVKDTNSTAFKLINYFGPNLRIPTFVGLQFTYHSLTLIPVKFMFHYRIIYGIVMGFVFLMCIWNGANFYIEKFSQSYAKQLQEIATTLEHIAPSPETPPNDKKIISSKN